MKTKLNLKKSDPTGHETPDIREDLMSTMAEINYHLPNVVSEKQEQVAQFMVKQLKGAEVLTNPFSGG